MEENGHILHIFARGYLFITGGRVLYYSWEVLIPAFISFREYALCSR